LTTRVETVQQVAEHFVHYDRNIFNQRLSYLFWRGSMFEKRIVLVEILHRIIDIGFVLLYKIDHSTM